MQARSAPQRLKPISLAKYSVCLKAYPDTSLSWEEYVPTRQDTAAM